MKLKLVSLLAPGGDSARKRVTKALDLPGERAKLVLPDAWADREARVDGGKADAAYLCGLLYAKKRDGGQALDALVAPVAKGERYEGKPVYFSDVIVAADSDLHSFEDLRGQKLVINEPASFSGCAVVGDHLAKLGEDRYFGHVVESGTHAASIQQVVHGGADAAAIDSTVLAEELARDPSLGDRLRVVETLGPFPAPPVAASGLTAQEANGLRDAFVGLEDSKKGRRALEEANVERFVPVTDSDYDAIREAAERAATVHLAAAERPPNPFLDDKHTPGDIKVLDGLLARVREEMKKNPGKARLYLEEPDGRHHRLIINNPDALSGKLGDLSFVGFFGLRRPGSDTSVLDKLDAELTTTEFDKSPNLASYSTFQLEDGRFANLVLFATPRGIGEWRDGELHKKIVQSITHTHYDAIRIHAGKLQGGMADDSTFLVRGTKKYEY